MNIGPERVDVLGVHVSAIDMQMALDTIEGWVSDRTPTYVCVTGVHGVMESQRDDHLRQIHNRSGMTTPDGMPLVWCGRRAGASGMERVYGPDLMLGLMERAARHRWRVFFYGSAPGVAEELAENLGRRFPGFVTAGLLSPPYRDLTDDETVQISDQINGASPDLVWVGLSTPKQERWMDRFRPYLDAPVLIGVGAAFDIHAGRLPQAPRWMQDRGLEWLYRLIKEPRRLWKRYLSNNPRFVWRILTRPPTMIRSR